MEYISIPQIRNQDFRVEEQAGIEKVPLERWGIYNLVPPEVKP